MKLSFIIILLILANVCFGQRDALTIFNVTKKNSFVVKVYENETLLVIKTLNPRGQLTVVTDSLNVYKAEIVKTTNFEECIDCNHCIIAPRDNLGRAILGYLDIFYITIKCLSL